MSEPVTELYDYDALRQESVFCMFVTHLAEPTVVLGGQQDVSVLRADAHRLPLRRRRGGGGLVLLRPGDLWIDWWIPTSHEHWTTDVRTSAYVAGDWWRDALQPLVRGKISVHHGALEGVLSHRVACFAGRGPGEVIVDDRKAVGVTQWRVREGVFLSSVLHAAPSSDLVDLLADVPDGLVGALDHHTLATLGVSDTESLISALVARSGVDDLRRR